MSIGAAHAKIHRDSKKQITDLLQSAEQSLIIAKKQETNRIFVSEVSLQLDSESAIA